MIFERNKRGFYREGLVNLLIKITGLFGGPCGLLREPIGWKLD